MSDVHHSSPINRKLYSEYYQWCQQEAGREVATDLVRLRRMGGRFTPRLTYMDGLDHAARSLLLHSLVKRGPGTYLGPMQNALTGEETVAIEQWLNCWSQFISITPASIWLGTEASVSEAAPLLERLLVGELAEFGTTRRVGRRSYRCETRCDEWQITTEVEVGRRLRLLRCWQSIWLAGAEPAIIGDCSLLTSLGVGPTEWAGVALEDVPDVVSTVRDYCKYTLSQMRELLQNC